MCDLKDRLGPNICWYCPPADRLVCSGTHFSAVALATMGRDMIQRFYQRGGSFTAYESHPEAPAGDFRPTEWTAELDLDNK